jgi:predicted Zn-dependent peptidase
MKAFVSAALSIFILVSAAAATDTTIYTLSNGMQVILKENHASPLVSSVVVVRAGSKFETVQNNGFTHLLEHMLFNGTEKRTREELNEGIKDHGGYINAFTEQEMTGYLIVMPREFIEFGLDIQADQLFNSILPEAEFPKERDIVVEEISKDNDNTENVAQDFFNSVVFAGTPYERPVIGYASTIRSVTRDEVIRYYKEYYIPNNMTALIIGDFETPEMKKLVERYFGKPPKGAMPISPDFQISIPFGSEIKIKRYPHANNTYIQISFPAPIYSQPDFYAFDVLSQYLNSGESSPLSQALTAGESPLASEVSVNLEIQKEFSLMNVSVRTDKPENVEPILKKTLEVLQGLPAYRFSEQDIRRVVVPNKVNEIRLEEKLHYYGIMKAPYLATCGYDFLENYVDNLSAVKPEQVASIAAKYFIDPKYVACALEPAPEVE